MKSRAAGTLPVFFCLTLAALFNSAEAQNADTSSPMQPVIQQVIERFKPSLVRIHVVSSQPEEGRETKSESYGSGVIISPEGHVVTNHHVAGNAKWLSCTLSNREEVEARLIGTDPLSDIAIIKLAPHPDGRYPVATWGDSSKLRVGDPVLAMGSPMAFSQSVTAGIVSNTELTMPGSYYFMLDGEDVGAIVRWIGHDAPIHGGNSGGPLVNLDGEIIGINEINVGLSGAIPGNLAREISEQLIKNGRVVRAYTGLGLQPRLKSDTRQTGVLVGGIVPSSPAAAAGFKAGDLLISVDNQTLDARFDEQLPLVNLQLARLPIDRAVPVVVRRGEQDVSLSLTARLRDLAEPPSNEVKGWGITGRDLSYLTALENKLPNTDGILVTTVATGSPAGEAEPALEAGDIILRVAGRKVASLDALKTLSNRIARTPGGTPTLVEVRRDDEQVLTVINVHQQNEEDTSVEVPRPWIPINMQVVPPELVRALRLSPNLRGIRVTQVYGGSIAEKAGLKVGDILTRMNGEAIEATQPEDIENFVNTVTQYRVGETIKLAVWRDGKLRPISFKLPAIPKREGDLPVYRDDDYGFSVRSISDLDRLRKDVAADKTGVVITAVIEGSWADLAGLEEGDIIHSIGGTPVKDMATAKARLAGLKTEKPRLSVFFVSRGLYTMFVEVQTDWSAPASTQTRP